MKLTQAKLKQLIREELKSALQYMQTGTGAGKKQHTLNSLTEGAGADVAGVIDRAIRQGEKQAAVQALHKYHAVMWAEAMDESMDRAFNNLEYQPVLEAEGEAWADVAAQILTKQIEKAVDDARGLDLRPLNRSFQQLLSSDAGLGDEGKRGWAAGEAIAARSYQLPAKLMISMAVKHDHAGDLAAYSDVIHKGADLGTSAYQAPFGREQPRAGDKAPWFSSSKRAKAAGRQQTAQALRGQKPKRQPPGADKQ